MKDSAEGTTREAFDRIAPGWYNFRHWSIFRYELEELAVRWEPGILLNAGCGHGPDFLPFKAKFSLLGVDFSKEMLNHATKYAGKFEYQADLVQADLRHLPFPDGSIDNAIAVATYHHIKSADDRLLKPGSEAFITFWNRWQRRFWFAGTEPTVTWKIQDETVYRYYYLHSFPKAENLVKKAGFHILESRPEHNYTFPVKYFSRNICLLVRKP